MLNMLFHNKPIPAVPLPLPPPAPPYVWLGDMILLGDTLRERNPAAWCGCAIGGALLAMGYRADGGRINLVNTLFPWLRDVKPTPSECFGTFSLYFDDWGVGVGVISGMFYQVCAGLMTIEQLADRVNAWQKRYDPKAPDRAMPAKSTRKPARVLDKDLVAV